MYSRTEGFLLFIFLVEALMKVVHHLLLTSGLISLEYIIDGINGKKQIMAY